MNKNMLIGVALAVVAIAVAIATIFVYKPPQQSNISTTSPSEKVYVYSVKLESAQILQMLAYYIPLKDGLVYGQIANQSATYFFLKNNGIINIIAQSQDRYQKLTYYGKLLEICVNSTTSATIAGEHLTIVNHQCTPSASPLPTAKSFDELVLLIQGLPGPTSTGGWKRSGVSQTPYGQATIYSNTTEVPIMPGLSAILNYEKQVLQDGTIYLLKIQLAYGTNVAATLTYTLKNITKITPDLKKVLDNLSQDVSAERGGGLDILKVAQKIGMSFDGKWPAAIVFFDLQCPYCARLFVYNYTLFEGHKLVLVDLIVHSEALPAHESLRCLYQSSPASVIPTLRELYNRTLALHDNINYTSILPQSRCPIDAKAGMELASLLAGQNVGTPMVVVVYPNGTYTTIVGYDPASIAKALKG